MFSYKTVETDQIIHNIMLSDEIFHRQGPKSPKMKENSETAYTFSTKIPEPLDEEGIWGHLPLSY